MEKIKLTLFNISMDFGGVENQLLVILNGLDRNYYDIDLLLCRKKGALLSKIPLWLNVHDLKINLVNGFNPFLCFKVRLFLKKRKPDILFSFHGTLNTVIFLGSIKLNKNILLIGRMPGLVSKGKLDFLRVPILKKLTKIIAVSDGVAQSLNEIYGKTNNIAVINNCIDKKIIKEQSFEFISDSWFNSRDIPKAICVGRLIESKNIDFLIKSIIKVNEKFPFKLVIIGDGPLRRKLESYIYDNDLIDLIKLLGFQINPYKYLAKSDVFLFGSKPIGEGLPNVILEAMFCKVPVVSTEYLNGKGEVIENNVNGILIRQNDVDKFANSIVDLYQDKSQTKKIIEEAYSLVSTKFSKENYIKQYHEMFLTLTKNN